MKVNSTSQISKIPVSTEIKKENSSASATCRSIFSSIFSREAAFNLCKGFGNELWNRCINASSHTAKISWGIATVVFSALAIPHFAKPIKTYTEKPKKRGNNV